MFKMSRGQPVGGDNCPFIFEHSDLRFSHVNHRLDGESHPGSEDRACAALTEIGDLWFLMEMPTDTMTDKLADDRITVPAGLLFDEGANIAKPRPGLNTLNRTIENLFG